MGKTIKPEMTPAELKAVHEFKLARKKIQKKLDDEEYAAQLRDIGRGDNDKEQGESVHEEQQDGDGGGKGQ